MGEKLYHIDMLRKRIDSIIQERPSHKEVLEFLREVMTEQYKIGPKIKTDPAKIGKEKVKGLIEGFPLLDKRDLPLDMALAATLFKGLCRVLSRNKDASQDAKRISRALSSKDIDLVELFKQTGAENGEYVQALSKKLGVGEGLLYFLAENSIRPILEAYAAELKGYVDQEGWWKGYCPICGSLPFIAELREEGERFLVCSSCNFEWRFNRLKCPFCENEDHKELRYFYTEREGKANRVDVCDKCKTYIKAIDVRDLPSGFISFAEDAGTLYMDVLAQAEGYKRRNNVWGADRTS
jgi:FdhE protein